MENGQITGAAVTALLKLNNKDELWLSEQLGTTVNYIYNIKSGKSGLSFAKAKEIAGVFNVPLSRFIRVGEKESEKK